VVNGISKSAMAQHTVAVVDDDASLRIALSRLLSVLGYRVELFACAEDFLGAAHTSKASCLVVDVNLGGLSGPDMVHRLSVAGRKLPTIFMTCSEDQAVKERCADLGCVALLRKPFQEAVLGKAVATAIGSLLQRA
jgi:FixJ family two-component response regulator